MTAYYQDEQVTLHHGDSLAVLKTLPDASVDCCVTSPPYFGLRDYGEAGQYGLEASPAEYVETMRAVFAEVRRVLADDGTLWLNIGDSYNAYNNNRGPSASFSKSADHARNVCSPGLTVKGLAAKNLLMIPARTAIALQTDGWILRSDIIWAKPDPMPANVKDRPTSSHEHVFLFAKKPRYWYDADAIAEPATGRDAGNGFNRPESISQNGPGANEPWVARPQLRRALTIAAERGLTEDHFAAIRSVGMNDAGKARGVQSGAGRNTVVVQALADEAKAALGGYYREFLTGATKNARDVWTIPTQNFPEAHFATFPSALAERAILAGCKPGGTVLDPFSGSGTTGLAANKHGRKYVGIDLSAEYLDLSLRTRFAQPGLDFGEVGA